MSVTASQARHRLDPIFTAALLLLLALVAWTLAVARMSGMDAGPGTDLGGLGWFLAMWLTMMAAMMLPSVAPMVLTFARVSRGRVASGRGGFVPTWVFAAGYLLAWMGYGLAAYGIYRVAMSIDAAALAWDRAGHWIAGAAVALAGGYQLSALKRRCLRHCRTPLHFVLHGWKPGPAGALRMGLEHGAYCVGCCAGLMVVLLTLGAMSLFWMGVVSLIVFVEKLAPGGPRLATGTALALVALGMWIAVAPGGVPGLTEPGGTAPGMQMEPSSR